MTFVSVCHQNRKLIVPCRLLQMQSYQILQLGHSKIPASVNGREEGKDHLSSRVVVCMLCVCVCCVCACMCVYVCVHMHACVCAHACICMCVYVCVHMHTHIYVCVVCMCRGVHVYVGLWRPKVDIGFLL